MKTSRLVLVMLFAYLVMSPRISAQTLLNIDFGVGSRSPKTGWAATGQMTNDFWNLYRHYDPKFIPGMPLVANGALNELKMSDGTATQSSLTVSNAPGVWGNATGDPMYDSYIFAQNGSNLLVSIRNLPAGRYHFYLYGHADPDVTGEQNSRFMLHSGTNSLGPVTTLGTAGWKANSPWVEKYQYAVIRDVQVLADEPVTIDVMPGINGVAVLNGLQIMSRGTSPPELVPLTALSEPPAFTNLIYRELRYRGKVSDQEARFTVSLDVESRTTNEISGPLFEGDVAVLAPEVPEGLRFVTLAEKRILLISTKPGVYHLTLEVVAKISHAEPWNQVAFYGPPAAIARLTVETASPGIELQLLSGTPLEDETSGAAGAATTSVPNEATASKPTARMQCLLGADRLLSLRWQSKAAEVVRKTLVTVATTSSVQVSPTVIKFNTHFRYDIVQAGLSKLTIALPLNQALTRLQGEQVRDWRVNVETDRQVLTVEFLKAIEKDYGLTLYSEQSLETTPLVVPLSPPQPLDVERESGSFNLAADDMLVEVEAVNGLRQVNAPAGALAAYRFNGRPFGLTARLKRIEPVIHVADRITARLEETRLLIAHNLALNIEKAGIYALELTPQKGLTVASVQGEGVDDWKVTDGKLRVSFASRVMAKRQIDVQLEQPLKQFPEQVQILPLRATNAARETAEIGATAVPGIQIKTRDTTGLREVPINQLSRRTDELLAYTADQPDWQLTLATERLRPRIVADIFNLITIGDGLVGGSATLRLGIINQGIQEFQVILPAHWKNVEFTGPGIRRKDNQTNRWTIGLQDKAWGGYTLVITYDFSFDPKAATVVMGGAHATQAETETGSIAITSAGGMQLKTAAVSEPLRRIDEMELTETDRALISRPVMLAYRYTGDSYNLTLEVTRFAPVNVLDAVADRTQLTTVITEDGQMLTQASFMVKNNEKQFQRFQLPTGAEFWSCYVNNQPAKAERDAGWLLVPLPREANRNLAFAVDLVYAQKLPALRSWQPKPIALQAPATDVPNTYAEWQIYAPATQRLSAFGGSMMVARGTTYGWRDAWTQCVLYYTDLLEEGGPGLLAIPSLGLLFVVLFVAALRRGWSGVVTGLALLCVLGVLASMLLPATAHFKSRGMPQSAGELAPSIQTNVDLAQTALPAPAATAVNQQAMLPPPAAVPAQPPPDGTRRSRYAGMTPEMRKRFGLPLEESRSRVQIAGQVGANAPTAGAAGGGGFGGVANGPGLMQPPVANPMAAGVRPIRVEIPREGETFLFTKVLNLGEEPLTVKARIMKASAFVTFRACLQAIVFMAGLILIIRQRHHRVRNSFVMTLGTALILAAVGHLLLTHRILHYALILGAPLLVLSFLVWLIRICWPRRSPKSGPPMPPPISGGPAPVASPPLVAAVVCLLIASSACCAELSKVMSGSTGSNALIPPAMTNAVSILSAAYTGQVKEKVAGLEATIRLSSAQTNQSIRLFGDEVAVLEYSATPATVQLVREGAALQAQLRERGDATLKVKFLVKLGGDVTQRQLKFGPPPALYSSLSLKLDEPEAEVEFPSAVSFKKTSANNLTLVEAVVAPADGIDIRWTPRMKRAAEIAATVFCQNTAVVTLGGGVANTRATLDYQISQGELRQLRVRIPAGQRLLRVEGEAIRTWEQKNDAGESVVLVELLKSVAPAYKLLVETEKILDALPTQLHVTLPHALDVKRETGLIALRRQEELNLTVDAKDLQRVDAEEFARVTAEKANTIVSAFRFLTPQFDLNLRAELEQPQIEAVVRNVVHIGAEHLMVTAQINYNIKRAGVFALRLALPEGYRVEKVTGDKILQWVTHDTNNLHALEITLKERIQGRYPLIIELVQPVKETPKTVAVSGVLPLETEKLTGYVSVSAEFGLAVKAASLEGLTEIPAASLPELVRPENNPPSATQNQQPTRQPSVPSAPNIVGSVLAYKFIAVEPARAVWKLNVTTETVEPWVRAEIVHTYTITETLLTGRALVRYEVANAPVKEFRLRVPTAFTNVELAGADIRRRDQTNDQWRVELQNKVRGYYLLTVTWEQPCNPKTNDLVISGIESVGLERETGLLAIVARPPLQVRETAPGDLVKIDSRELPEWAGRPNAATVAAYRYLRPGYRLGLDVRRFAEAEVLQALVDSARLVTVVADDGQTMTDMQLTIRNNGRQYLQVELPAQAKIWSALVAGQPVRPCLQEGKILLPLERSGADGAPFSVQVVFIGSDPFPRTRGVFALASPKFDVPLKNVRWELYLPPDYRYTGFGGTMAREIVASAAPVVSRYSFSEYTQQENRQQLALNEEAQNSLRAVRGKLAEGNIKEAVENYRQVRSQGGAYYDASGLELKSLESDLNRAQGSNLILAQNNFSYANQGQMVVAQQKPQAQVQAQTEAPAFNNDMGAAEQQWLKLRQAQELATAKVQPLWVNLPQRGLLYAFNQVLQTELRKPMTIQLTAMNLKATGWGARLAWGLASFLVLWIIVAIFLRQPRRS